MGKSYIKAPIMFLLLGAVIAPLTLGQDTHVAGGIVGAVIGGAAVLFLIRWANHTAEPPHEP